MKTIWLSEHLLPSIALTAEPLVLYGRAHGQSIVAMASTQQSFLQATAVAVPKSADVDQFAPVPTVIRCTADGEPQAWTLDPDGNYEPAEVRVVSAQRHLQARNDGALSGQPLADCTVAIVGAGSQGSMIARPLVQAGIGTIAIGDGDVFEPPNVSRHALGLDAVGLHKAVALADHLRLINPALQTAVTNKPLTPESRGLYEEMFASADLVIVGTDSRAANLLAQEILSELSKRAIFIGVWERAEAAEIIYSDPAGGGACYACIRDALPGADRPDPSTPYALAPSDGPTVSEPGLGADVMFIASVVARLALDVLTSRQDGLLAGGASALLVSTKQTELFAQACQVSPVAMLPDPECWHCASARWRAAPDGGR